VRLRHTLIDERCEWQQRIQAQLYHHGVQRRRDLLRPERALMAHCGIGEITSVAILAQGAKRH
jgi:hypothetical protein